MKSLHLAVDIGTSSLKGGLFTVDGSLSDTFHVPLGPTKPLVDPRIWINAFRTGYAALQKKWPGAVASVTVSGNGPTILPVFQDGRWGDALMWHSPVKNYHEGCSSYFLPRIVWYRDQYPGLYEKARSFLTCPDFLSWALTGVEHAVIATDAYIPVFWAPGDAVRCDIDEGKLPPLTKSGSFIGRVSKAGSALTGVHEGVPVYAGGLDYLMSLLGTGTVEGGTACDRAGTSEGINYCSDTPVDNPYLRTLPHVIEDSYHVSGILSSTGRVFEWFRHITGQGQREYVDMMNGIRRIDPRSQDPRFFPSSRHGAIWEFASGAFTRLHPHHTSDHMGKAVVEAIGFGIRDVLSVLETAGCRVGSLSGSGGQMRNPVWTQMKADIIGIPVCVPRIIDAELLGCLCCALQGLGRYGSLKEASLDLVVTDLTYEPDLSRTALYEDSYDAYLAERDLFIAAALPE
ncbi:MAG: carbohydrate kinase [Spirochaetales bacterium]|nr:carbohydrate kinase [Spirochaetales bacterium]